MSFALAGMPVLVTVGDWSLCRCVPCSTRDRYHLLILPVLSFKFQFTRVARELSPTVTFQCRLSYSVHAPSCERMHENLCAHLRSHSSCQTWMEYGNSKTLSTPCRLIVSHSWLSLGKATWISHGRNPNWTIMLFKKKKKRFNRAFSDKGESKLDFTEIPSASKQHYRAQVTRWQYVRNPEQADTPKRQHIFKTFQNPAADAGLFLVQLASRRQVWASSCIVTSRQPHRVLSTIQYWFKSNIQNTSLSGWKTT